MSNLKLRVNDNVKYSTNLHSSEIWKVMISILYEAAAPLAAYGNMSIETALSCLALSTNNRRKISASNADVFLQDMFYELSLRVEDNSEQSKLDLLDYILNKGVERNIIVDHIVYSLVLDKFPKQIDKAKLKAFVATHLEQYDAFKQDVVFRYYHVTESYAYKNYHNKFAHGLRSTKQDMFHVYIISAMRAIDKFIPYKGTLTSYIETWFQNAKGSSDFMVYDNEAISVNRAVRRSLHEGGESALNTKAIPLADREHVIKDDLYDEEWFNNTYAEFSRHIAKLPNSTIMFLALNLVYELDKSQIDRINEENAKRNW